MIKKVLGTKRPSDFVWLVLGEKIAKQALSSKRPFTRVLRPAGSLTVIARSFDGENAEVLVLRPGYSNIVINPFRSAVAYGASLNNGVFSIAMTDPLEVLFAASENLEESGFSTAIIHREILRHYPKRVRSTFSPIATGPLMVFKVGDTYRQVNTRHDLLASWIVGDRVHCYATSTTDTSNQFYVAVVDYTSRLDPTPTVVGNGGTVSYTWFGQTVTISFPEQLAEFQTAVANGTTSVTYATNSYVWNVEEFISRQPITVRFYVEDGLIKTSVEPDTVVHTFRISVTTIGGTTQSAVNIWGRELPVISVAGPYDTDVTTTPGTPFSQSQVTDNSVPNPPPFEYEVNVNTSSVSSSGTTAAVISPSDYIDTPPFEFTTQVRTVRDGASSNISNTTSSAVGFRSNGFDRPMNYTSSTTTTNTYAHPIQYYYMGPTEAGALTTLFSRTNVSIGSYQDFVSNSSQGIRNPVGPGFVGFINSNVNTPGSLTYTTQSYHLLDDYTSTQLVSTNTRTVSSASHPAAVQEKVAQFTLSDTFNITAAVVGGRISIGGQLMAEDVKVQIGGDGTLPTADPAAQLINLQSTNTSNTVGAETFFGGSELNGHESSVSTLTSTYTFMVQTPYIVDSGYDISSFRDFDNGVHKGAALIVWGDNKTAKFLAYIQIYSGYPLIVSAYDLIRQGTDLETAADNLLELSFQYLPVPTGFDTLEPLITAAQNAAVVYRNSPNSEAARTNALSAVDALRRASIVNHYSTAALDDTIYSFIALVGVNQRSTDVYYVLDR